VFASAGNVIIMVIVLQFHVTVNVLVVTQFETCWQFDAIGGLRSGSAFSQFGVPL
jgi:hypothetical protein